MKIENIKIANEIVSKIEWLEKQKAKVESIEKDILCDINIPDRVIINNHHLDTLDKSMIIQILSGLRQYYIDKLKELHAELKEL